jgi:hypothetical protein
MVPLKKRLTRRFFALENAVAPGFEGTQEELEELLLEGLNSGEAAEADESFWNRLSAETDIIAAQQKSRT